MSSDNVQMQWGDIVSEETFILTYLTCPLSFLIGFFNSQTKEALKVEVCFMSASKIYQDLNFRPITKQYFYVLTWREKKEKKMFSKISRENTKRNGILLPKLFWPTVRKNRSRKTKFANLQNFWNRMLFEISSWRFFKSTVE